MEIMQSFYFFGLSLPQLYEESIFVEILLF